MTRTVNIQINIISSDILENYAQVDKLYTYFLSVVISLRLFLATYLLLNSRVVWKPLQFKYIQLYT